MKLFLTILALTFLLGCQSTYDINSRGEDQDLKIRVNKGGTMTDAITVDGATGIATFGVGISGGLTLEVFTSSGTWTVPEGVTHAKITVIGGGASGDRPGDLGTSLRGGGGGGVAIKSFTDLVPGSTCSLTVASQVTAGPSRQPGGASSITCGATTVSCTGGQTSYGSNSNAIGGLGGNGGTCTGGDINSSYGAGVHSYKGGGPAGQGGHESCVTTPGMGNMGTRYDGCNSTRGEIRIEYIAF